MSEDDVMRRLETHGFAIAERSEIQDGVALRLVTGQVVNVYGTGTVNVQGKDPDPVVDVLAQAVVEGERLKAPPISDKRNAFALYKPDLKGKHVLVITPDELRRIEKLFEDFAQLPVSCAVFLADGYVRTMSVEELCAHENSPRQPIHSITIHTESGDNDPKAEIVLSDIGNDTVEIEIYGAPEKVEPLRHALEDRLAAMTPAYAWIAKRDTAPLVLLVIFGVAIAMASEAWGPSIALVVLGVAVTQKKRYFPRTAYRIGQGDKRYEVAATMRVAVVLSAAVSLATSIVLALVGL